MTLTLTEGKACIYEIIDSSNNVILEDFWLMQLKDIKMSVRHNMYIIPMLTRVLNRDHLTSDQNENLVAILKWYWRSLFNVNIINKFFSFLER